MRIKHLIALTILLTSTIWSQAQQINAVPDYVFRNQMSVGRNAVTDTAAYFSIGPRYGATKGFMPPIVGDTATFSSGKRNGLLIFSVQKNKFLYWDSVRVQWSDMAGSSGSYIVAGDTATMLTPYVRHAGYGLTKSGQSFLVDTAAMATRARVQKAVDSLQANINAKGNGTVTSVATGYGLSGGTITTTGTLLVDTLNIATRAWRQKGLDSLAALEVSGSGTTNYVPKFTAASTIGNSQIFDNGTNVGIGITTGMSERFNVANSSGNANASIATSSATSGAFLRFGNATNADGLYVGYNNPAGTLLGGVGGANAGVIMGYGSYPIGFGTNAAERLRIFANGRVFVGASPSDAGYQFDIAGNLRTTTGANFATSSGSVGIGTASPSRTLHIYRAGVTNELYLESDVGTQAAYYLKNTSNALYMPAGRTGQMRLFVNAADRVTFDSTGFVGIGTTTPTYNLDVNGTLRSVNGANFATTSGNVGIGTASPAVKLDVSGVIRSVQSTSSAGYQSGIVLTDAATTTIAFGLQNTSGSDLPFLYGNSGLGFGTNVAERMRITSSGELLINTFTDAGDYKLQVSGNIYNTGTAVLAATSGEVSIGSTSTTTASGYKWLRVNGSTGGVIELTSGDARVIQMQADGTSAGGRLATITASPLIFGTAATNRMRVTADGEVFINTESDAGDYKLQVAGNVYATGGLTLTGTGSVFTRNTANTSGFDVGLLGGSSVADAYVYQRHSADLIFGTANIARMRLSAGGNFGVGTSTPVFRFNAVKSGTSSVDIVAQVALDNGVGGYGAALAFSSEGNNNGTHKVGIGNVRTGGWDVSDLVFYANNTVAQGDFTASDERMRLKSDGEFFINTTTDAGDYKLQVVGNARIGTGKLDIASNTTYGLGIARSGTSEVAGQIYNSSGILYTGVEGSAGGAIFTGSSAYAAVIGSGAAYSLQFATNNVTRATIDNAGALLIGATTAYNVANKMEVYGPMMIRNSPTSGTLNLDSTALSANNITNRTPFQVTSFNLTGSGGNAIFYASGTWNTTAATNAIDVTLTNTASGAGSNYLRITDGVNQFRVTKEAEVVTAAPTGGSIRKWKLGEAATVSPTSPNRTIRVEIDGTVYYLHAKTTND